MFFKKLFKAILGHQKYDKTTSKSCDAQKSSDMKNNSKLQTKVTSKSWTITKIPPSPPQKI